MNVGRCLGAAVFIENFLCGGSKPPPYGWFFYALKFVYFRDAEDVIPYRVSYNSALFILHFFVLCTPWAVNLHIDFFFFDRKRKRT